MKSRIYDMFLVNRKYQQEQQHFQHQQHYNHHSPRNLSSPIDHLSPHAAPGSSQQGMQHNDYQQHAHDDERNSNFQREVEEEGAFPDTHAAP